MDYWEHPVVAKPPYSVVSWEEKASTQEKYGYWVEYLEKKVAEYQDRE